MTAAEAERLGTVPDDLDVIIRRLHVPMMTTPVEVGGDHLYLGDGGLAADSSTPRIRLVLVRTADAAIGAEWNAMALQGTGSVDITVDGAFVPDALVVDPMSGPVRGGPLYQLGYQAAVSAENLGFTMGQCQRFLEQAKESTRPGGLPAGSD